MLLQIIQYIALAWAVVMVPYVISLWIRCIVHNVKYYLSLTDLMNAVCIVLLWKEGLPFP